MSDVGSSKKRVRVINRKTIRNKMIKSQVRTLVKRYEAMIGENNVDESHAALPIVVKKLDQASAKGIFTKNTISRMKSRLQLKLNKTSLV